METTATSDAAPPRERRLARWAGPALVAAASAGMLWFSRGIWPDVLVDFGHEIFVFWRISEGQVLFRDIAHLKGPLSPYVNGLAFRAFGTGLDTLVFTNLAVLVLLMAMLHSLFTTVAGRVAAALACLTLVTVFAFAQLEDVGSYNFLCPYSHEVTHGVVLSAAAIFLLAKYHEHRSAGYLFGAGLAVGLAALTDGHVFLAGLGAGLVGVAVTLAREPSPGRRLARGLPAFLAGVVLPPAAAFALLALAMPPRDALLGALGSVRWLLRREIVFERLYRWQMGTLDPAASLKALAVWSAWYVVALVPPTLMGALLRLRRRVEAAVAVALFVALAAALLSAGPRVPWNDAFRPLPIAVLLVAGAALVALLRARREPSVESGPTILRLTLAVWALGLLSKILLNVRVMDYGFALAMPALLLLVGAIFGWLPQALAARGIRPRYLQATALALLLGAMSAAVATTGRYVALKQIAVGAGRDTFRADPRGQAVNLTLEFLARRARPGDTLAVMPEGAMINYLARVPNPTPFPVLAPPEVALYGEQRMLDAFRANPPDRVVFVHADSSIHGFRFFGEDYGRSIRAWVEQNYTTVAIVGARPFVDHRFGIQVLEKTR